MRTTRISGWLNRAESQLNHLLERVDQLVDHQQHIVITGLSRSGKSMLFTSLIAQLQQRGSEYYDPLPLLKVFSQQQLEKVELTTHFDDLADFPFAENLAKLQARQWPQATDKVSAFRLTLWIKRNNPVKQKLFGAKKIQLFFYDYPGEWLMDLPLESMDYAQWSAQVFAQLSSEPQASLSQSWLTQLRQFDFDQLPTEASLKEYIRYYQQYLSKAKKQGVSLLQPGMLILTPPGLVHSKMFAPLPNKVLSDPTHPWRQVMQQHYQAFVRDWVIPFKRDFFNQADKQVILVDVLEGLSFGRGYLEEMKEAMNHLSNSFVYGKRKWYQRLGITPPVGKVGFVATKIDLIPVAERANLKQLLAHLTQGIGFQLEASSTEFEHFLISALVCAKPETHSVIYKDEQGRTLRQTFDPIPRQLSELNPNEVYPRIHALPPKLTSASDWHSIGLDELMNYFLKGVFK